MTISSDYWNANLSATALSEIRTILMTERNELQRLDSLSSPGYLALYPTGNTPGKRNIAKVDTIIAGIDEILTPHSP